MFYGGSPGSFDPIFAGMQQHHQLRYGGSAGVRRKGTPPTGFSIGGLPSLPQPQASLMGGSDYGPPPVPNNDYGMPDAGMQPPEEPRAPRREPNRAGRLGFGGFRAMGGPVEKGKAYVVGERGPEVIVPDRPGMVLPNAALPPQGPDPRFQPPQTSVTPAFQSNGPMMPRGPVESFDYGRRDLSNGSPNSLSARASARDGIVRTGSLADRGGRPGGGSRGMTPQRRLEMFQRRAWTRGDEGAAMGITQNLFNAETYGRRGVGSTERYQPRFDPTTAQPAPAAITAPTRPGAAAPQVPREIPQFGPTAEQQPPPAAAVQPGMGVFSLPMLPPARLPDGSLDITQPLPPSTLGGGSGVPPLPDYSERQVGGFNVLTGPDGKGGSKFLNAYTAPDRGQPQLTAEQFGQIRTAGYQPTQVNGSTFDPNGVPYLERLPPVPEPTERITERTPDGGTRTFTQPRSTAPAAPTPPATAQPGIKTPSGNQFRRADSTQTGQLPNTAHQSPLTPESSLFAARDHYARTGDDSLLREHFNQFPSQAVQLGQQEQALWRQIGAEVDTFGAQQADKARAGQSRDDYIRTQSNPAFAAVEYDNAYPSRLARMDAPVTPLNFDLMNQAADLSRRAAVAAGRSPGVPPPRAMAPQIPMLPQRRNPSGILARLDRTKVLPLPGWMLPTNRERQ